jgi:primosomal protein N'
LLDPLPFVEVLGPAPFPVAKMNDEWRFRIVLKTQRAAALRAAIRERVLPAARADRATRLAVNVDP